VDAAGATQKAASRLAPAAPVAPVSLPSPTLVLEALLRAKAARAGTDLRIMVATRARTWASPDKVAKVVNSSPVSVVKADSQKVGLRVPFRVVYFTPTLP
jgi:hypothetical protein